MAFGDSFNIYVFLATHNNRTRTHRDQRLKWHSYPSIFLRFDYMILLLLKLCIWSISFCGKGYWGLKSMTNTNNVILANKFFLSIIVLIYTHIVACYHQLIHCWSVDHVHISINELDYNSCKFVIFYNIVLLNPVNLHIQIGHIAHIISF